MPRKLEVLVLAVPRVNTGKEKEEKEKEDERRSSPRLATLNFDYHRKLLVKYN